MNFRKLVLQDTAAVAVGQVICVSAMIGVFSLAGKYGISVLLGGIAGGLIALANFFFMTFFADMAADKARHQDIPGGQKLIRLSYTVRMTGTLLLLAFCAKSGFFHLPALALPLLFTRPILTIQESFLKKGGY